MPNALVHEKSPYLLQHADNPVDWLPWSEAAFAKARAEQKPLFVSIGYSTCHWCHVMADESFENAEIAALLNADFVPVKIDREERPDVDRVYLAYVQAMTGQGGWPLNVWLTPELKPFYGGTYFPPQDRQGRAGFPTILRAIARGWETEREKLVAESERVIAALSEPAEQETAGADGTRLAAAAGAAFEKCFQYLFEAFDPQHGGFGGAPRFPRAANLNFLFRVAALQGPASEMGAEAVKLATATLRAMAQGGIHDHVGGGFHRYAVDEAWFVPHFEKMLYDQAQIALNGVEARQATGDERFAWLARDILDYVRRELTHPSGGFYSAEDADSSVAHGSAEHAEGAFYVWSHAEFAAVLGAQAPMLAAHFGVAAEGNIPARLDPQHEFTGKNILAQRQPLAATARGFGLAPEAANDELLGALGRLREARARRPRPHRDDKIITAWNGLMLTALARSAQVLGDPESLAAAIRAAGFVRRELWEETHGVLFRAWREGRGSTEGFAEDYAFLGQGLIDLYEATFEPRWLQWADRLQTKMDELFWDDAAGGYFNSRAGDASIVLRLKEDYDGAEPAPSSIAAMNLLRLGAMLNDPTRSERGRRCVEAFRPTWMRLPHALPQMLCAAELALEPARHVVIAGDPAAGDFRALAAVLHERLGPRRMLLCADGGEGQRWLSARAPWLAAMRPIDGRATAYVCEDFACQTPVAEPSALRQLLWPDASQTGR